MKIRKGFVSNSSSSSFIVRITPENSHLMHHGYFVKVEEVLFRDNGKYNREEIDKLISDGYTIIENNEGYIVFSKIVPIEKLCESGLGRNTTIGFGREITDYMNELKFCGYDEGFYVIEKLQNAINEYGLENIAFVRESDEGMGGYLPDELKRLVDSSDVICEFEWH